MILKFCKFFFCTLVCNFNCDPRLVGGGPRFIRFLSLGFNLGFGKCIWLKRGHVGEQPADGTYTLKMMGS